MVFPKRGAVEFSLLYEDEAGDEVGLEGVQLLDEVSPGRLRDTEALLQHAHPVVRFQAALILAAWGQESGVRALESLIEQGGVGALNLAPHRLTGEDNCLDEAASALHYYAMLGGDEQRTVNAFHKLLKLYPDHFFESKFKSALMNDPPSALEADLKRAILGCLDTGRFYQGSQLLPVYAQINPAEAGALLSSFVDVGSLIPAPEANVAQALGYIPGEAFDPLRARLLESGAPGVADAARDAMATRGS